MAASANTDKQQSLFGDVEEAERLSGGDMKWLGQLKVLLFPPVTQRMALDIATQALAQSVVSVPLICHGRKPARFSIYANLPEPCWWVQVPWNDEKDGNLIRSSRVIVIGRQTGKVHYDGSAGDEG